MYIVCRSPSLADQELCSSRNVYVLRDTNGASLADQELCSSRNARPASAMIAKSLADQELCSSRNTGVWYQLAQ